MSNLNLKNVNSFAELRKLKYGAKGTEKRETFESEAKEQLIMARLAELRKAKQMTQKELSKEAKLTIPMISKYENKKGNPTLATFIRMVDALKLDDNQLLQLMGR